MLGPGGRTEEGTDIGSSVLGLQKRHLDMAEVECMHGSSGRLAEAAVAQASNMSDSSQPKFFCPLCFQLLLLHCSLPLAVNAFRLDCDKIV